MSGDLCISSQSCRVLLNGRTALALRSGTGGFLR
jgi:hypothetical protein